MTLYELNQIAYAKLPELPRSVVEDKLSEIDKWISDTMLQHRESCGDYYMLLNNDLHYYTIFNWTCDSPYDSDEVAKEIMSIVQDLGVLKAIEYNDNGAWEFWITKPDDTTHAYYLFDYTRGVVEI